MSVNRAILIGNVGKEPEVTTLSNGKQVAKFSLATSESWKGQDGERQERTTWHNIVIYNEGLARIVQQYVHKGSKLYIEGAISNRSYEKDGVTKYVSEITLQGFNSSLKMLGERQESDNNQSGGNDRNEYAERSGSRGGPPMCGNDMDDEIPFAPEFRV